MWGRRLTRAYSGWGGELIDPEFDVCVNDWRLISGTVLELHPDAWSSTYQPTNSAGPISRAVGRLA